MITASSPSDISLHISKPTNRSTKYFIYGDKKYAINFILLINNCNYFYRNRKQYKDIEDIKLLNDDEDHINLSEESIQAFISSCQNEKCQIKASSIIPLRYLAYKYEYPALQEITDKYIEDHSDELLIQTVLFNPDSEKEEQLISANFGQFIKDDQLLQLPISTLDRIFQKYKTTKSTKKIEKNEIINFLFKCLDHYGRDASILFNDVDFQEENVDVVNRLLNKYSNDFDFNMINSTLAKTTMKLTSELTRQKEEFAKFFKEMKVEFEKQKLEVMNLRDEEKKARIEEEKKYKKKIDEYKQDIEKLNSQINQRMKSIENDFGKISQRYEKNIENGKIVKYQKIFLEVLNSEFGRLSDESKLRVIEEIIENQQNMNNDDNEFVQKVIFLINLFKILTSNNSLNKIKPLYNYNKQELVNFFANNMKCQFDMNADFIEYLGKLNILQQVLKDILNFYNQITIEIKYPTKSFQSTVNSIPNILNQTKQNSDKIVFKLTVDENPKPEEMNSIRNLINVLKINSSTKAINDSIFNDFSKLSKIEIMNGITAIGKLSFKNCALLKEISIPASVQSIGDHAFEGCTSLTEISIPTSVNSIGKSIFNGCKTIKLSKNMTSIPSNLFNGCTSLTKVSIPTSVQSISDHAFEGCTSLTEISIPASVNTIGDSAFEGCTSLAKVSIPASVKSIGKSAFKNCPYKPPKSFAYSQGGELNGIIRYFTNKTGGNIHDNGTIKISASSNWNPGSSYNVNAKNLCDFNDFSIKSMWSPNNQENSTLLFDFKNESIKITDYTIHTPSDLSGGNPQSWVVECTNDMNSWATVDTRNNEAVMKNQNVCHTFKCQSQSDNFYRYIRFKSTGKDSGNSNYFFDISAVEFFGFLKESNQ